MYPGSRFIADFRGCMILLSLIAYHPELRYGDSHLPCLSYQAKNLYRPQQFDRFNHRDREKNSYTFRFWPDTRLLRFFQAHVLSLRFGNRSVSMCTEDHSKTGLVDSRQHLSARDNQLDQLSLPVQRQAGVLWMVAALISNIFINSNQAAW